MALDVPDLIRHIERTPNPLATLALVVTVLMRDYDGNRDEIRQLLYWRSRTYLEGV